TLIFVTQTSYSLSFYSSGDPRDLLSFPTRRSSDLRRCGGGGRGRHCVCLRDAAACSLGRAIHVLLHWSAVPVSDPLRVVPSLLRSEEHTSELQSRENLVCRLLLEKKKILYMTARDR